MHVIFRSIATFGLFYISSLYLTPNDFGTYNYILAIAVIFAIFADFGISVAISKFTAENNEHGNKDHLKKLLFNGTFIVFFVNIIIFFILLAIGRYCFPEIEKKYLYLLFSIILFISFSGIFDGILRGLKKFKEASLASFVSSLLSLIAGYYLIKYYSLSGALISKSLIYAINIIGQLIIYHSFIFKVDYRIIVKIIKYSIIIGTANLGYFLCTKVDVIILGNFGYLTEISSYEIINKIFQISFIPFMILGQVLAPFITVLFYKKKYKKLFRNFYAYLILIFSLGIIFSLVFYFISPWILDLLFKEYSNDTTISMIKYLITLLPINFVFLVISHGFIHASGYARIFILPVIVMSITNIALDYIFIIKFGFFGVIYATLIVTWIANASPLIIYYHKIKCLKNLS